MALDIETKPDNVRNELKKLSPEERILLLQEISIEEVKAEEDKIKADPLFPLKNAIVNISNEIETLKKQIEKLKYELNCCNASRKNEIINDDEYNDDYSECFSWWPIIIFFLFIIITSSIGGGSISRCPMMPKMHFD